MEDLDKQKNQELWESWTELHLSPASDYAGKIEIIKNGGITLSDMDLCEVSDVRNKTLLHLQCHLGLDTLSWARLGATVTGVDFSEKSIHYARNLASELNLPARFINADIYTLPSVLDKPFDIVWTGGGALIWLKDLTRWAQILYASLKPGGRVWINEFHPLRRIIIPQRVDALGNPVYIGYFPRNEPVRVIERGSYATPSSSDTYEACYWPHSLGEIITSLCQAGLRIEYFHEYRKVARNFQSFILDSDDRLSARLEHDIEIPNSYYLCASRDK